MSFWKHAHKWQIRGLIDNPPRVCYKKGFRECFLCFKTEGIVRMAYQPLEELLPKASMSIYRLVRLASMRATELATTGVKLVQAPADQKLATTALDEIRAGKVVEKGGDIFTDYKEGRIKKNAKS